MADERLQRSTPLALTNDTLRQLLDRYQPHMQRLLPKHLKPERMFQVALLGIQRTPRLLQCTPASLIGSLLQCAQLGLEPDGLTGKAYLVPYFNRKVGRYICEVIPGYKGLMDLARRSGHVNRFSAFAVYEGDEFDYEYGFDQRLHYKPLAKLRTQKTLTHAFAFAYEDGEPKFHVCTRDDVDFARKMSKSPNDGPWVDHFEAMSMKTAVRRFVKFLPQSYELATAVALDELAETELPQGVELLAPELMDPEEAAEAAAEEQARAEQPRKGGPFPSDVIAAGKEVGWDVPKTNEYVQAQAQKLVTELQRGEECQRMIAAIRTHAKSGEQ
jgi:recombination protein RecT